MCDPVVGHQFVWEILNAKPLMKYGMVKLLRTLEEPSMQILYLMDAEVNTARWIFNENSIKELKLRLFI